MKVGTAMLSALGRAVGLALVLASLASVIVHAKSDAPGVREVTVGNSVRGNAVRALIWYPSVSSTQSSTKPTQIGASGVFVGSNARPDAPVAVARHPLILVSHGGFRSAANSANWLASALTRQGYIVAVVTPPAIRPGPPRPEVLNELSFRPSDLSSTISALETSEVFRDRLDFERVAVVGFFMGGYSALALAGFELDRESLAATCAQKSRSPDCDWFSSGGVDLQNVDLQEIVSPKRSLRDHRVDAVVAIDPEWIHSASQQSLKRLSASTHFINVGPWGSAQSALNAEAISRTIPGADYVNIPEAGRFSTFAICTAKGPAILKEAGEDARLCQDGNVKVSRAQIHRRLVEVITNALGAALGSR